MIKELLKLRKDIKKRKPRFIRQKSYNSKKLGTKWRRPHGIHSKVRRKFKSRRKQPSLGYSSPRLVRGLHPSGLKPIIIHNVNELKNVQKDNCIIISGTVGLAKKIALVKKIKELKLPVVNIKNVDLFLKEIDDKISKKRAETENKKKEKKQAKEELLKKAKEKEAEKEKSVKENEPEK